MKSIFAVVILIFLSDGCAAQAEKKAAVWTGRTDMQQRGPDSIESCATQAPPGYGHDAARSMYYKEPPPGSYYEKGGYRPGDPLAGGYSAAELYTPEQMNRWYGVCARRSQEPRLE